MNSRGRYYRKAPPSMTPRHGRTRPAFVVDEAGEVLEVGGQCGLVLDVPTWDDPPTPGDWIATKAGTRYLVDHVQVVRRRTPAPRTMRYQLRTLRLPKHAAAPADVHVIWLSWYPRARSRT